MFPRPSRAATFTAGAIAAPAVAELGCTLKASWVAAPGRTLNGELVPGPSEPEPAARVYAAPALSTDRFENVATPAVAPAAAVPPRWAPAVPPPSVTVTVPVKVGSVLPLPSSAVTVTAGAIAEPAVTLLGCVRNAR